MKLGVLIRCSLGYFGVWISTMNDKQLDWLKPRVSAEKQKIIEEVIQKRNKNRSEASFVQVRHPTP